MKKQINTLSFLGLCLFFMFSTFKVRAQALNTNGVTNTISLPTDTTYHDYIIPEGSGYNAIYLEAFGADGGRAYQKSKKGGRGAKALGYLRLGDGTTPPGSTIRFIVGVQGETKGLYGGGGGGTAIAVKRKGESSWDLVMVAGGGGGGGTSSNGREGTNFTSGSNGYVNDHASSSNINRGTNGSGGGKGGDSGGGGGKSGIGLGAIDIDTSGVPFNAYGGQAGFSGNVPTGGNGGVGGQNNAGTATWAVGGWGFGGGGAAYHSGSGADSPGGGGGGYSGGGGGYSDGGGGGGGSYVNYGYMYESDMSSNGSTSDPTNGKITYKFTTLAELPSPKALTYRDDNTKCLGTNSDSPASKDNIELINCATNADQTKWVVDGAYLRLSTAMYLCLDLEDGNTSTGNNIQLYNCNEGGTQKWIYDGYQTSLRYKDNPAKCATLNEATNQLAIADCNEIPSQKFIHDGASTTPSFGANSSARIIKMDSNSDRCLDIKSSNTANKTNIQLYNCNGTTAQKWLFNGVQIKMYDHQDKCLDLASGNTNDGNNIWLYSCSTNNANQNWIYDGLTQAIRLQSQPDKCLDIDDSNLASGANLQIKSCDKSATQQFNIFPEKEVLFGSIKNVGNPTQCIDLESDNLKSGINIKTTNCDGSVNQYWYIQGNQIQLAQVPSFCFALTNYDAVSGDNVHLWECKDQDNEKWFYDGISKSIRTKTNPRYCLTVSGTNIQLNSCTEGNANQQWKVPDADLLDVTSDGRTNIISKAEDQTLTVYPLNGATKNGSQVITQNVDASMDQGLRFNVDGSISIVKRPDRCLDQLSGSTASGTKIQVFPCTGYDNQKWIYDTPNQLFRALNNPDMCMQGGSNGTSVTLATCSSSTDQKFIVK